jgi:Zn-dependent peptidase ImmA (M78 family)
MNKIVFQEKIDFARQLSSTSFPTNPFSICRELGIDIIDNNLMKNDGYLIFIGGNKLIFVSSRINNRHRRKFIISHEIGHFLMHHDQLYCCSKIEEVSTTKINSSRQELAPEINCFRR